MVNVISILYGNALKGKNSLPLGANSLPLGANSLPLGANYFPILKRDAIEEKHCLAQ